MTEKAVFSALPNGKSFGSVPLFPREKNWHKHIESDPITWRSIDIRLEKRNFERRRKKSGDSGGKIKKRKTEVDRGGVLAKVGGKIKPRSQIKYHDRVREREKEEKRL